MPDIAQWLTELGLEKYISDFAEAEIDLATLPDLVEDDLEDRRIAAASHTPPTDEVDDEINDVDEFDVSEHRGTT